MSSCENQVENESGRESPKPHHFISLALDAVTEYLKTGISMKPPLDRYPELKEASGLFVSFRNGSALRGCIGTLEPTTDNLGEEIIQNAISSATRDNRFAQISVDEIDQLSCSIDVIGEPDLVHDIGELDPSKFGIIVKNGVRQGLLLPGLEGVDTIDEQIAIAKKKANISQKEYVEIYKFETRRYR